MLLVVVLVAAVAVVVVVVAAAVVVVAHFTLLDVCFTIVDIITVSVIATLSPHHQSTSGQ